MKGVRPATQFLVCWLAAAGVTSAQTIDLQSAPGRRTVDGHVAGARAGAWLHIGDLTGDYWTKELIVGAPDDANARGTVRLYIGIQRVLADTTTTAVTDVVLTGASSGDRFGAAADAGYVTQREVQLVDGSPSGPTPARDLIVGAPGAIGGRGRVYVFEGPFVRNTTRAASSAGITITGAPGDGLGSLIESADLNGDGYREVILPVPARGIAYAIDVHNAPTPTIDLAVSVPGTVITGLGNQIAIAAGDMTGDGIIDLAVASPNAQQTRGVVYLFVSRTRVLPAAMPLPGAADGQMVGEEPGDQLGASLWVADIDDDSDFAADLLVGVPGADGAANGRPESGAVYVVWGRSELTSAFRPSLVLHGAAAGHRLGTLVTAGNMTRRTPHDVVMLAAGANGGAGEVFVYYGRHLFEFPSSAAIDLATAANRRIVSDETAGPIRTVRMWEATGEGAEEVVVGVPDAGSGAGKLYIALSPRIDLSTATATLRVTRCVPGVQQIEIRNPSVISVPWRLTAAPSWAEVQPETGETALGSPATVRLVVRTGDLAPGTYSQRVEVRSSGPDLGHAVPVTIQLTVDPPSPLASSGIVDFNGDGCGDVATFRHSSGVWRFNNGTELQLGKSGDMPVPGDYNGDSIADAAVYRPSDSTWHFANGDVVTLGQVGDLPVPADYDGDGTTDIAVYRPSSSSWIGRDFGPIVWGAVGDRPVPGDYNGDGRWDLAVYEPSAGRWKVRNVGEFVHGSVADIPVPADYDGDGRTDAAVYQRSTGVWNVRNQFQTRWGLASDLPIPMDVDRDGKAELRVFRRSIRTWFTLDPDTGIVTTEMSGSGEVPAFSALAARLAKVSGDLNPDGQTDMTVWRPRDGMWYVKTSSSGYSQYFGVQWGAGSLGDVPVTGDYDGDGFGDIAVWRPGNGIWYIRTSSSGFAQRIDVRWGDGSLRDMPLPADYDGDGRDDLAIWRPGDGTWYWRTSSSGYTATRIVQWGSGALRDVPLPADFDGDGRADLAVWRPESGVWYVKTSSTDYQRVLIVQWGLGSLGDVPVPGDFDGDGRADIAVWRTGDGTWYVKPSSTGFSSMIAKQWGSGGLGDVPVLGDFDGDGRTDMTVWRPGVGVWYVKTSTSGFQSYFASQWGLGSLQDVPIGVKRAGY